jgi:short-subunit dehydrogenase
MTNKLLVSAPLIAAGVAGVLYARSRTPSYIRRGRVSIITGGSSGLGLALAHRFGRAGLKLVLAARTMSDLERAKLELLSSNSVATEADVHLFACDLSQRSQADALIGATVERFGTVDVLINNAGVMEVGPMEDQPVEAYERSMAVNFFSAVYTSYAALPILLKKKASAIVNISSVGGKVAVPHLLPYVASKFALTGFSEGMHAELRQRGVRVITVCPGLMRTGGETHAKFRGQVMNEKAWFQTSARTPFLAANVTRAAERIFSAVKDRRSEITITPQAWLAARFAGIAPESTQVIAALVNSLVLPSLQKS